MTASNGRRRVTSRAEAVAEAGRLAKEERRGVRYIAEALTAAGWPCEKSTAANLVREHEEQEPFLELLNWTQGRRDMADRLNAYGALILEDVRMGAAETFADRLAAVDRLLKIEKALGDLGGFWAPKRLDVKDVTETEGPKPDPETLEAMRKLRELEQGEDDR